MDTVHLVKIRKPPAEDSFGFRKFHASSLESGYLYEAPITEGVAGSRIHRREREIVNLASISFMGFQEDPVVLDYFCDAAKHYGLVTGGSRATQGVCAAHKNLEELMNRITGREYTVTFGSGLLANVGFLNAITARFGFDDECSIDNRDVMVIMDHDCHWSLWKGASHLCYGKNLFAFRHNDPNDLDAVLSRTSAPKKVVVFESVYSSDGGVAPIGDLLDVCERHNALSYVDDANGFMVYGRPDRPYWPEYRELHRATFLMVSFSKAVGLEGGAISGPREYVQAFEALSGTSIFTAAMQPPTAATAAFILDKLDREPEHINSYLARVARLRRQLCEEGFQLYDNESYISSILLGHDQIAEQVRQFLFEEGFAVPVFRYPAVRRNQAIIRLILNNRHTEKEIDRFIGTLRSARRHFDFRGRIDG